MEPVKVMTTVLVVGLLSVAISASGDAPIQASAGIHGTASGGAAGLEGGGIESGGRVKTGLVVLDSRAQRDGSHRSSAGEPAQQWACSSSDTRGVLIARLEDRVGSCVSLTQASMGGALDDSGLTDDQAQVLVWALELFEEADMDLPTSLVTAERNDGCDGHAAVVNSTAPVPHIRLCTSHIGPALEWVMLHELGHIWAERHVDVESRKLFLAVRSLVAWRSDVWTESGTEHAADVIVWALMDRPVRPVHFANMTCIELEVAFRALTGERPLHGFTEACGPR